MCHEKYAYRRWTAALVFMGGCLLLCANITTASAQERPRTIFDMLFGSRKAEQAQPKTERRATPQRARQKPKRAPKARPSAPSAASPSTTVPLEPVIEKKPDAKKILVIGDFIGGGLAQGLDAAFASDPSFRIVSRIDGSSGFVRNDHFDWPQNIKKILDEEKPAAVVVMIGSNDRQAITGDKKSLEARSPAWMGEYQKRVARFVTIISEQSYPLVWVGQPPFRPKGMSEDMLALNEIHRSLTEKSGGKFADVWDGFIDEEGNFTQTGFDINGQTARLRGNDGINITSAGKRKLAFYAEKPLRAYLGGGQESQPLPAADATDPLRPVDRIPPVNLRDINKDESGVLLGGNATVRSLSIGPHQPAKKPFNGRADDFSWPRKTATP